MSETYYSSREEAEKAALGTELVTPNSRELIDPAVSLFNTSTQVDPASIPEDVLGEQVAYLMARYQTQGYVPNFREAIAYRKTMNAKKSNLASTIGDAMVQTTTDLGSGMANLAGDALTLKVHKVGASLIEGAARGTKNWWYMYEQAKYDENSFLSKMLYDNDVSDEQYYENLKKTIELNKIIEKDKREGIVINPTIELFGEKFDLTNEAVVQAVSYVADPSWLMPNLGIEAALAKSMRSLNLAGRLGEQLTGAAAYAAKKTAKGLSSVADFSGNIANAVQAIDTQLAGVFTEATGTPHYINGSGSPRAVDAIYRNAENTLGANILRIPLWPLTSSVFGVSKVVQGFSLLGEAYAENAFETKMLSGGLSLSERVAANSEGSRVANFASFYSRNLSPITDWMSKTAKTGIHGGMYGGAFGLFFGGEEGAAHGFGTGIVLGSAFHQVGAFAETVAGTNKYRDTLKNFIWATEHYDYNNQEGLYHLMNNVTQLGGEEARWSLMAQIGAFERIQRDHKVFILTEAKIKEMSSSDQWNEYERMILSKPEYGGVTFSKDLNGDNVILINADRAAKSAVNEELFHSLLLEGRYKKAFVKNTVEHLLGTEDNQGALYRMPKEQAVSVLEQFRDQYLNLDKETAGHIPEALEGKAQEFNRIIEMFKNGERPPELNSLFEEFTAAYWNRYIEEKPIDYLIKGGNLGLIRNAIEWGKDLYRGLLKNDLGEAGVKFADANGNPDLFLINERTKQRVRVPMMERLMKQYVREINDKMYKGWVVDTVKYRDTHTLLNNQLDHLVRETEIGKVNADVNLDAPPYNIGEAIGNIAQRLQELDPSQRSLKMQIRNENGQTLASFSRAKKTVGQTFWRDEDRRNGVGITKAQLRDMGGVKKGKEPRTVEMPPPEGKWSVDKRGQFWESVWEGNPRIVFSGRATNAELSILAEYLPKNVVSRFNELNRIIEHAKNGKPNEISNILKAAVITESKEKNDGSRIKKRFMSSRRFIPVELSLYFERVVKKKTKSGDYTYQIGEASMLAKVIDYDALLTREDYAFNKVNDGDLNYKTVRRLFGSQAELRNAVKMMLSNYSLGNKAQAGIKLFTGGRGGERDAALKRDIVNAVIGYHPTKAMERDVRSFWNTPREMQFRQGGDKVKLPTVMTDFRVDHIGTMRVEDGEGFRYNHDEAYKRSQANFSPAITSRDHEGNMLPYRASKILGNTVYRNKEGEIISVYSLRTPYSEMRRKANPSQIYDVSIGEMVDEGNMAGAVRGSMYTSPSGWLHFTADGYEAGYTSTGRVRSGYIDTKNHLDISDLGNSGSYRGMVAEIGKRVAEITNTNAVDFIKELLKLEDANGNKLSELFKNEKDLLGAELDTVESWLFTRQSRQLFEKYGIDSIEYMGVNPNTGNQFSSVAVFESGRFIENRSRGNLDHFRFSPSKPISEQLDKLIKKAGGDGVKAVMRYVIDEDGNPVFNKNLITPKVIDGLVRLNEMLVADAQKMIDANKLLSNEAIRSYEEKLVPVVVNKLRAKFPEADDELLKSIARTSLKGFVDFAKNAPRLRRKVTKPFGVTTEVINYVEGARVSNSGFIEGALKAGIDSSALIDSGIPSLGHWIEMSESDFIGLKGYEAWKKQKQSENRQAIADAREFEKWLKEHTKKYEVERTSSQRRAEGEMITEIERRKKELLKNGIKQENLEAKIDEEFPAYASIKEKGKERIDKLKQEETARFEKLSPLAQEMFALNKEERKKTNVLASREKFLEEKLTQLRMRQGVQGLADAATRQEDLFFVMDAAMTPDFALSDKFNLSAGAKMKLKTAMVLKTRQLVLEQLKLGKGATFKQINEAYKQLVESQRNIPEELSMAMAKLADYQRKAESIIKEDHAERMLDIMTAYGLKELDLDIVEQVRAVIYDEASQGKYDVGSFEAIARSAEVYGMLDGIKNKRYIDVRKAIKENFVKALDDLEKKGYRASYWSKYNTDTYQNTLMLGNNIYKSKDVRKFDGGEYYIVYQTPEEAGATKHRVMFTDGDGKILNQVEYVVPENFREAAVMHSQMKGRILEQATFTINKTAPALAIKSGKFMEVFGGSKDYLLRQAFKARGLKSSFAERWRAQDSLASQTEEGGVGRRIKTAGGESVIFSDKHIEKLTAIANNWELYKNGDFFLAVPILSDRVLSDGKTIVEHERTLKEIVRTGKIEHPEVKQGRKVIPARTEVLTPQQIASRRVELVRLQQQMLPDLGFSFKLDKDGSIEVVDAEFTSIQQREASFADLKKNAAAIKASGLENLVSKAYIDFAKMLQKHGQETQKRVALVLSEKDKRGAIPQIKELLKQVNDLEATKRQFVTKEMLRYNRENEQRGTGKKESVDAKKMNDLLVDRLDNYRRKTNTLENQVLAVADQLDRAGLLTEKEGFSPDAVDDYQRRIALAGDTIENFRVPEPQRGANLAEYYANLKMEFRRRQIEFVNSERMATQLYDSLYGHQEGVEKILPKVEFLIKRYLEARGFRDVDINSAVFLKSTSRKNQFKLKSVTEELGSYITNEEGYTTVRWQELKYGTPHREAGVADAATLQHQLEEPVTTAKYVPVEKSNAKYLRDKNNRLESVLDDDFYTIEELQKQFADGLDVVAEKWYRGKDRGNIKMESILKMGMERSNTEDSIASLLAKNLSEHNLDAAEIAWLHAPENRSAVLDLHRRWATDEDSPHEIISEIRSLTISSNYGKDGANLMSTVSKLNETYQKIGAVIDRLQVLTRREVSATALEQENPFASRMESSKRQTTEEISSYRLNMPETIDELTEELKALRGLKTDLQKRYDAILKKAGGKYASPEFRKLVKSMKDMDVNQRMIRRQTARYFKEKEMIQKQIETSEKILFQQYDTVARNLRDQNPELVFQHSRILISKDNPYTQRLFYAFPQLAYDFFGNSSVLLDMSLVTPEGQKQIGLTKPINSNNQGSGLGNQVLKNDRQNGRRNIYLADYIHYAVNKRRWHERNPSEAMSAADAELFRYFFRKDVESGLFKEQIARIPKEKIESQQNFMNGIIDHFRSDDERSRFIRSFVMDAFDLVSKNNGLVERAFMSLKNMTRGEFEALKRSNPDYMKRALDSKEVIERAFYLLPRGVVEAGNAGAKVGMRDYAAIKMTPQENLEIRRIERANGYNEGDVRRIINGEINKPLPEEAAKFFRKRQIAFRTREELQVVPIDTLIRMTGFDSIWKEHMQAQGIDTSLFGLDGMWTVKAAYEDMSPAERFAMPVTKVNRLLLENKANQMKSARESKLRYKKQKKAILDPEGMANWTYGESESLAVDEQKRVSAILAEAAKTEISIQRYKNEINTLITKRGNAVRHMLSLDDNLRIEGMTQNKNGEMSIDWDNPDKPQWRDTVDGRYFIRRTLHKGKEVFDIIFKGETFKSPNGQVVASVNTSKFATVTDLTEAQVAIRLFEDDIQRVKVTSKLITGGDSNLRPLAVGEQPLEVQNVPELVTHWDEVPAFSREVLRIYTQQKGLPFYRERMAEVLSGIGQHGEYVWVKGFPDGSKKSKKVFITPDKEGVYADHYIKTVAKDGLTLYIRKKDAPVGNTSDVQTPTKTVTKESATNPPETEKPDKVDKVVSDSSNWDVIEIDKSNKNYEDWTIIKNQLGYTLMRLTDRNNRTIFRLFNPASAFMSETYNEIEAMEIILKKELSKL